MLEALRGEAPTGDRVPLRLWRRDRRPGQDALMSQSHAQLNRVVCRQPISDP